jgi:hypothetical protein
MPANQRLERSLLAPRAKALQKLAVRHAGPVPAKSRALNVPENYAQLTSRH